MKQGYHLTVTEVRPVSSIAMQQIITSFLKQYAFIIVRFLVIMHLNMALLGPLLKIS